MYGFRFFFFFKDSNRGCSVSSDFHIPDPNNSQVNAARNTVLKL